MCSLILLSSLLLYVIQKTLRVPLAALTSALELFFYQVSAPHGPRQGLDIEASTNRRTMCRYTDGSQFCSILESDDRFGRSKNMILEAWTTGRLFGEVDVGLSCCVKWLEVDRR